MFLFHGLGKLAAPAEMAAGMGAPVLMGAIAMVHWPRWAFTPSETHPMGGMEFQVTLLCLAIYFMLTGVQDEA